MSLIISKLKIKRIEIIMNFVAFMTVVAKLG